MIEAIEQVRDRLPGSRDLMRRFVTGIVEGTIPDYQVAAWLMAVYLNGMSEEALFALTEAMAEIGTEKVPHAGVVDKHSTGGVGDKTTLVLAPLVSSLGISMVKMSGRGLGHTGGTLDKLESIPGFTVQLSPAALARQIEQIGVAVVAQSAQLAPADGIMYALRDVTGTVDSIPLIASSIMSKKMAGGAPNLVLDVKVGSGALMKTVDRAEALARLMVRMGQMRQMRVHAVLTSMDQPLGESIGNALEVNEAIACLKGDGPQSLRDEVIILAQEMVAMAVRESADEARLRVIDALDSGRGYEQFMRWIAAQNGSVAAVGAGLPVAPHYPLTLHRSGYIARIDTALVGTVAQRLGAGRKTKEDRIDFGVGIRWMAPIGTPVSPGQEIGLIYARSQSQAEDAAVLLRKAITLGDEAPESPSGYTIIVDA